MTAEDDKVNVEEVTVSTSHIEPPKDNVLKRDLKKDIDDERRKLEGRDDPNVYVFTFEVSKCNNFKELMTLFQRCGYTFKLQMTMEQYLDSIPENIRHTAIRRQTREEYIAERSGEPIDEKTS